MTAHTSAGGEAIPKLVGLVLRHRRALLISYMGILHILLYVLLQARGHRCSMGSMEG